ncbi:MAG: N-6 DNA methylase [Petrotoga mobilis]|nr:MAG: N-6 DNA methylase [Petrotoga mobilis]
MAQNNLDTKVLEIWLWEAACKIRGSEDAKNLQIVGNI